MDAAFLCLQKGPRAGENCRAWCLQGLQKGPQARGKESRDMDRLKELYQKYREWITYIICGGFTTLVNIVVYWLCADVIGIFYLAANFVAWILSVLFAFVTNRTFVFRSRKHGREMLKEFVLFVSGRVMSMCGDMLIMFICVSLAGMPGLIAKIFSNVFVVVFNYVFSKLIIFKK